MKGIDKKACAGYLVPQRVLNTGSGVFGAKQIEYVIVTDIKRIGHRKLLILYLYSRANAGNGLLRPRYVMFQASDSYITFDMESEKWRIASLERLESDWSFKNKLAFYSKQDENRARRFCKASKNDDGISAITAKQDQLLAHRAKKRAKSRDQRILDRMKPLKPVGKRFEQWAKHDVLPKYIFYDYVRDAKSVLGTCTACGHEVEVLGAKHNRLYVCPHCRKEVTLKSRGKFKRIWDRATVLMLERAAENELALRVFKVHWSYHYGKSEFEFYESAREFITWGEDNHYDVDRYYNTYDMQCLTTWRHGLRPRFSYYQDCFAAETFGHLYTRNLKIALKGTPWQYCAIDKFYELERDSMEVEPYLHQYLRKPCIEYLVKLGLSRLASYAVYREDRSYGIDDNTRMNTKGKNLKEVLGIGMEDLPLLQEMNASYEQFCLIQGMRNIGIAPNRPLLEWCGANQIGKTQDVIVPLRYMSPHKLTRYIEEQYAIDKRAKGAFSGGYYAFSHALSTYRDYLEMCEGLRYDMQNSFVLFPQKLLDAHDIAVKCTKHQKDKANDRAIVNAYSELKQQYGFHRDGLMIVPPRSAAEIIREGHALHHCVGTYPLPPPK